MRNATIELRCCSEYRSKNPTKNNQIQVKQIAAERRQLSISTIHIKQIMKDFSLEMIFIIC